LGQSQKEWEKSGYLTVTAWLLYQSGQILRISQVSELDHIDAEKIHEGHLAALTWNWTIAFWVQEDAVSFVEIRQW
jgi:hypothetical protein